VTITKVFTTYLGKFTPFLHSPLSLLPPLLRIVLTEEVIFNLKGKEKMGVMLPRNILNKLFILFAPTWLKKVTNFGSHTTGQYTLSFPPAFCRRF
jgi:hypothetical protein